MAKQSVIKHQLNILFALFIRDMNRQYKDFKFGNIWVLLEPMLMIVMFMILFGLRGRGAFGYIEPPLFILAAFLPFKHFFMGTMKECGRLSNRAKQFVFFNQIRFSDVVLSSALGNYFIGIISGVFIACILYWVFGLNSMPKDLLGVLIYTTSLAILGMFLGLMISMIRDVAKEIGRLVDFITMPLLFLSAVFYPMALVPEPYRTILAYNPLVHPMELIRENWFALYVSPVADPVYFGWWLLSIVFFVLMVYTIRRNKVLVYD